MSSVWDDWTPYKAIDSVDNSDPNCDCCSGTNVGNAWWKLDLGSTYPIATIIFIGRSDSMYLCILCV